MSGYREKITRHTKRQKTQFEETEQASEPDMAGKLELSDWKFKTTIIKMLRALMDKVDSMAEQMDDVSRNMKILRTEKKC